MCQVDLVGVDLVELIRWELISREDTACVYTKLHKMSVQTTLFAIEWPTCISATVFKYDAGRGGGPRLNIFLNGLEVSPNSVAMVLRKNYTMTYT